MKKSFSMSADAFSRMPLLVLLPVRGRIGALPGLRSPFFARYEKVKAQRLEAENTGDLSQARKFGYEESMLKQALDWVALHQEDQDE